LDFGEPSVSDTIAILRGLKERYEVHHGVRIKDNALVSAATLSHRYISDRFLPDKAIDLVDEAASKLRIEIGSMPTEIDEIDRRIIQLQIEKQALSKEKDKASKSRLEILEEELKSLQDQSQSMKEVWQKEKGSIESIQKLKEEIEETKTQAEIAERDGDLNKAAELKYGKLHELNQKLEELNQAQTTTDKKMLKEEVTEEDIAEVVARWTGIPVSKMLEGEAEKLIHMEDRLKDKVIGQDHAIVKVSNAVRRARAGLQDINRPIGSFIFLGPTGVGKTETAKALAQFLFDDEQAMVRIDMSEFMEKHSVSRLVGAPPGYVGYEEGGYLTEAVRRRPYSIVLLDEIEKAHPDVFNILLQILDDGRLTDSQGRTVDFKNSVIIMTSNVGSSAASFSIYFRYSSKVVAPTQWSSPRARAGFNILDASIDPSLAPAPTKVWSSSINKIISPSESEISFKIAFNRSSNSPRYFVPAIKDPKSREITFLSFKLSGTSCLAILKARPSTIAVLPTPGSPINTGLFLRLLDKTWITRLISSSN
jgi:ATP-dependent Clp protease ATP-binding subunit ClpB